MIKPRRVVKRATLIPPATTVAEISPTCWISLFISIAPSLGFLGTIIGMIQAFDKIQQVGDISATVVAGGIKVALLTTLLGLIIAIILQVFYNYILSLIEGLVNEMEDSSISLLDLVVEYDAAQKK